MKPIYFTVILLLSSCTSLQAGLYLSSIDRVTGDIFLQMEPNVYQYLESVNEKSNDYSIKAYERKGIGLQFKKTKLLTHSYYVITNNHTSEYDTLSYGGTNMAFYSEGSWQMNTDSDKSSYTSFIDGTNEWDVDEIPTNGKIDTKQTVNKILLKIESNITYYYMDHLRDKAGYDNCNTALYETLTTTL
jgi:hypothetical protein